VTNYKHEGREGLPESTGWTLFNNIDNASQNDKFPTASATSDSEVKM